MKYTNEEKFQLGQLCAKFKKEYDESKSGSQEYWCTKRKKMVQYHAALKDGFYSRAVREFYKDLANCKESDPMFSKAKGLARRSLNYYNTFMAKNHDLTPEQIESELQGYKSALVGSLGRPSRPEERKTRNRKSRSRFAGMKMKKENTENSEQVLPEVHYLSAQDLPEQDLSEQDLPEQDVLEQDLPEQEELAQEKN